MITMAADDSHQPVGLGTIEWEPYFASIRDYAPNALQILEYAYIEPGVLPNTCISWKAVMVHCDFKYKM